MVLNFHCDPIQVALNLTSQSGEETRGEDTRTDGAVSNGTDGQF